MADCNTALETLQCVRPDLIVIDVASVSVDAAVGLLNVLEANVEAKAVVPIVAATCRHGRNAHGVQNDSFA